MDDDLITDFGHARHRPISMPREPAAPRKPELTSVLLGSSGVNVLAVLGIDLVLDQSKSRIVRPRPERRLRMVPCVETGGREPETPVSVPTARRRAVWHGGPVPTEEKSGMWAFDDQPLALRGADLSFTLLEEQAGNRTRDDHGAVPIERLLASNGANCLRLRLWVEPLPGWSDLPSALALARRGHEAGMSIYLAFHCSDTWADPAHQSPPAAWRDLSTEQVARRLHDHARDTVAAFAAQGTPVAVIQIGNEVTNGFLWPLARLDGDAGNWQEFTTLVAAGVAGARAGAATGREPAVLVHTEHHGDARAAVAFYGRLLEAVDVDIIGLSYYPFWHGPLADLRAVLGELAERFAKRVAVVESAYPWTLPTRAAPDLFCSTSSHLPDEIDFPPTPAGQAAFFEALRECLQAVPDDRGLGFLVWEPGWFEGVGWAPGQPSLAPNLTLFDTTGRALPAVRALRRPERSLRA
jgi:arabinogalactan endo-1,4-beta-galactosidase